MEEEPKHCLNCGTALDDHFCSHCGQKATTRRITLNVLFQSIAQTLSNLDKGFLYNFKNLTLSPGRLVQGYLSGKRKAVFNPIQYAVIGITLVTLLETYFSIHPNPGTTPEVLKETDIYKIGYAYGGFVKENLKYLWLLNILFFSATTYFLFKTYNLAEHIIINAFVLGHASFITCIFFFMVPYPVSINPITYLSMGLLYFAIFKNTGGRFEVAVISLLSIFIGLVLYYFLPFFVLLPFL
jgi:hypothetical protein